MWRASKTTVTLTGLITEKQNISKCAETSIFLHSFQPKVVGQSKNNVGFSLIPNEESNENQNE